VANADGSEPRIFRLEATARSDAAPADLFDAVADATKWKEWGGLMMATSEWEQEGTPPPGGVGAIRRVGRWPQFSREQIIEFDPPHHLAYTLLAGLPVRDYRSDVVVEADGSGSTLVWRSQFRPKVPGTGPLQRAVLQTLIGRFARQAASYASRRQA
jgi:uncharacterized protein YndB with AHSA1/START domain